LIFSQAALAARFANLRLVDADPLSMRSWHKLPKPAETVCVDVTGCVQTWMCDLRSAHLPWVETRTFLPAQRAPKAYAATSNALLSLNILSQLQIVWHDGVEAILQKRFGRRFVKGQEAEWLAALRPAGQTLVERHLAAIEGSRPEFVLIITDLQYLEYRGKAFARGHWAPEPLAWSASEGWHADKGVSCKASPALEGVELNAAAFGCSTELSIGLGGKLVMAHRSVRNGKRRPWQGAPGWRFRVETSLALYHLPATAARAASLRASSFFSQTAG